MVKAKKHLGQHFLKEPQIAEKIASIALDSSIDNWLEIGPGTGVLTKFLLQGSNHLQCVELDRESVDHLAIEYPDLQVHSADFLKVDYTQWFASDFGVIGNFPYNISSQIVFNILENRDRIPEFAGMFQLEVAQRFTAEPHSKTYGVISVLLQAFYDVKFCFKVSPGCFNPPPKVWSGVIHASRKPISELGCNEVLFKKVVKAAFGQRRKTLANALKTFQVPKDDVLQHQMFKLRAENLSVGDFVELTNFIEKSKV